MVLCKKYCIVHFVEWQKHFSVENVVQKLRARHTYASILYEIEHGLTHRQQLRDGKAHHGHDLM